MISIKMGTDISILCDTLGTINFDELILGLFLLSSHLNDKNLKSLLMSIERKIQSVINQIKFFEAKNYL